MLQEEVQKMRAEQVAAARREKTLMKKKMKDNIKSSGKITSFFQRKQIAVVATAQPAEEDPDKEVSRRTIARKCNEQIQLLFQQTQSYQTQLAVLEKMNKTLLGSSGFYKTSDSAWQYIIESIQSFIADLKSKHPGRLPSHASAAKQAVCAAVSTAVPHNELTNVANTLGLKRQDLVQGQQRYTQYFDEDDERNILFELTNTLGGNVQDGTDVLWFKQMRAVQPGSLVFSLVDGPAYPVDIGNIISVRVALQPIDARLRAGAAVRYRLQPEEHQMILANMDAA